MLKILLYLIWYFIGYSLQFFYFFKNYCFWLFSNYIFSIKTLKITIWLLFILLLIFIFNNNFFVTNYFIVYLFFILLSLHLYIGFKNIFKDYIQQSNNLTFFLQMVTIILIKFIIFW